MGGHLDVQEGAYELVGRHLENAMKQYAESDRQYVRVQDRLEGLTVVGAEAEIDEP